MKRGIAIAAFGVVGLLAGCGSDGIEFNGVKQVEQFPVRKTPIVHYNLPVEVPNAVTSQPEIDASAFIYNGVVITSATFTEKASPGHDLWAQAMRGYDINGDMMEDWGFLLSGSGYRAYGSAWPDVQVQQAPYPQPAPPAEDYIEAWVLSIMNQRFLRDIDGNDLIGVGANPPVQYEGAGFASLPISIHETASSMSPYSPLLTNSPPSAAQQETTLNTPPGAGSNGIQRVNPPMNNVLSWLDGAGPAGLSAVSWREPPAKNLSIETTFGGLSNVPVPDYFGGGGGINALGGVYVRNFVDAWAGITSGSTPTVQPDDGVLFSYYLSVVGSHLIGYGLGLADSAFALPGVINDEEDVMNVSVVFDMTAFMAAGKRFNFVLEDLLRMQDVVNGDFMTPGILSTLPGTDR